MYCSSCGTHNPASVKFCTHCGGRMNVGTTNNQAETPASLYVPPSPTVAPPILDYSSAPTSTGISPGWKRALTVGVIIEIGWIAWFALRPTFVGVTIDVSSLESNIESTYAENGISVIADCPDPFVARPGESRNCLVTDDWGTTAIIKVSVENTNGDVTWAEQ